MTAMIYGVGVGPGNPDLLTLRGVQVLQATTAIVAPAPRAGGKSLALRIAQPHLPAGCDVHTVQFPMTEVHAPLQLAWDEAAALLVRLAAAQSVAFITLGDALLYSTWSYVLRSLRRLAPEVATETVPGITAMAACAAAVGQPLAEGREPLLVWPDAPPADSAGLLALVPNVVFMKADRHLAALAELADGCGAEAVAVRRASQPDACSTHDLRAWAAKRDYLTTVLMRRKERP